MGKFSIFHFRSIICHCPQPCAASAMTNDKCNMENEKWRAYLLPTPHFRRSSREVCLKLRLILTALLFPAFVNQVFSQSPEASAARSYRQAHEYEIIEEFGALLSIPNVASDAPNIRRNAELISRMLEKRGVKTRLLEIPEAPPVVFGEIDTPGATRTLIFYAHYDGQPVEPAKWVGGDPFRPTLRSVSLSSEGPHIGLPANDIEFPAKGRKF